MIQQTDFIIHRPTDPDPDAELILTVTYRFTPGEPPHYGSLSYAGDPGFPAEVDYLSVTSPNGRAIQLTAEEKEELYEQICQDQDQSQTPNSVALEAVKCQ